MPRITIELSVDQMRALTAVSDVLRRDVEETARILLFVPINTNYGDKAEFIEQIEPVVDAVTAGGFDGYDNGFGDLCGFIPAPLPKPKQRLVHAGMDN